MVIPRDPWIVGGIRSALQGSGFWESKTDQLGTNFFFVPSFTDEQTNTIRNHPLVRDAYVPVGSLTRDYRGHTANVLTDWKGSAESNLFDGNRTISERSVLSKRAEVVESNVRNSMVLLSWPPGTGLVPQTGDYKFDSSAGEGTYVYSCDYGANPSHPEFSEILSFAPLFPGPFAVTGFMENDNKRHGSKCIGKAVGKTVGVARKARVVATVLDFNTYILEHFLDALALIHEDIYVKGRGAQSVVNLSISIEANRISAAYQDRMGKSTRVRRGIESTDHCLAQLIRAIISLGAVFTTGSGNLPGTPSGYPALFGNPSDRNYIEDLIVVGSVIDEGVAMWRHSNADWLTCYAPGDKLRVPDVTVTFDNGYDDSVGGTSYGMSPFFSLFSSFSWLYTLFNVPIKHR